MEGAKKKKGSGGRPKQPVRKEKVSGVRFTKAEHFLVRQKAQKAGLSFSMYLRQMAIHGVVKSRLSEEESRFVRQLVGMSNNLNQLVKSCHEANLLTAMLHFQRYRDGMDELLKKLKVC